MQYDKITIQAIEEKVFKQKVTGGYDPDEVDEFLDDICDEMASMIDEMTALRAQLEQANEALVQAKQATLPPADTSPYSRHKQAPPTEESESIAAILRNAQLVSDNTVREAHERADEIVAKATEDANMRIGGLSKERDILKDEIDALKGALKDYHDRFIGLIDDQKHVLDSAAELLK